MRFTVEDSYKDKRLDVFVSEKIADISRSKIKTLCDAGKITVNGKVEPAKTKLKVGDEVIVDHQIKTTENIAKLDLAIMYEDNDVVVIDKPGGILTHSKGAYNSEATVATFINDKLVNLSGDRAGIVHRLDRATSGVIITAKNKDALNWLQKQFSTRKVKKTYIAIVNGKPEPESAVIDMPIERNPKAPQTFRVGHKGREARTEYKQLKTNDKYSLIELKPTTGRTHQIRVHLKRLGYPIVGDTLYGGESADRVYLHAYELEITLPNKERKIFRSNLPKVFDKKFDSNE